MFPRNVRHPALLALLALAAVGVGILPAQSTGTVRGTVTRTGSSEAITGVQITVRGVPSIAAATNVQGRYVLSRVPTGAQTLVFRWPGYAAVEREVNVNGEMTVDVAMEALPVSLADVTVSAASREPERIVEAPAAVTLIEPQVLQNTAPTGQAPLALAQAPGVDLVQSGVNDFNINARGFNSSLNRRVLTLLDGRDLAIAFLGSQEWNTLPVSMDELRGMELVRGPGSALYGANAFAGVINMTTLSPRESPGGKFSIAGGELESVKADGRWAGVFSEGRFGVRVNGGYASNDTWSRSRTLLDKTALQQEYAEAVDGSDIEIGLMSNPELRALMGQTCGGDTEVCAGGAPRTAEGDRDPITAAYGSARLDWYLNNGGAITFEGGASSVKNEVLVTGIGRIQVVEGFKPYGRVAYSSDRLNIFGYMNRRESKQPQYSLASGAELLEKSDIMHVEAQGNADFMEGAGRIIVGASFRQYNVNTSGTLMPEADDDRSDKVYSGYGQMEYRLNDQIRLVGAARYDEGDLFEGQFSPKGGIVFSPNENHSFRFTVNRAFQTPNYSEFFLAATAGAQNLAPLEAALRASELGPVLAGVPNGQLFSATGVVPLLARGNRNLDVESTVGYELGWKGALSSKVYVTVDAYMNNIKNFVTDLLQGVNPEYAFWTPPAAVPEQYHIPLQGAIAAQVPGLHRLPNAASSIVVSYTNEGEVDQKGVDVGMGYQLTDEFRLDGTFSYFDFEVVSQRAGDQLVPNTPEKKGTVSLGYIGLSNGFDATLTMRVVEGYDWAAGIFVGKVPSSNTINASAGYQLTPNFRIFAVGTNLLDQQRYHLFAGSVIGRRVLGGVTARF